MAISDIYWKNNPGRPGAWEVAGLRWLAEAPGGARLFLFTSTMLVGWGSIG